MSPPDEFDVDFNAQCVSWATTVTVLSTGLIVAAKVFGWVRRRFR